MRAVYGRTGQRAVRMGRAASCVAVALVIGVWGAAAGAEQIPEPTLQPLESLVDLSVGESVQVELTDGTAVELTLLAIDDERDTTPQKAVRRATATVEINGQRVTVESGKYNLPIEAGGVQIDSPVTAAYDNAHRNVWQLQKDARFRLWPKNSPWIQPDTFQYPVRQRLFASDTHAGNVPVYVDGGERPTRRQIYYHEGFDFGGYEGKTEVVAATDGVVVSIAGQSLDSDAHPPVRLTRYDVLYLRDDRGWYYRYSHMKSFETPLQLGGRVRRGQKIGDIGKEGGSGGWAHLHFDISVPVPAGGYGVVCAYAYLWEAYRREYDPDVVAVARPHHVGYVGETITLEARRSRARDGIASHRWTLSDGTTHTGPSVQTRYAAPGSYSEILEVTDVHGNVGYDFAVVQILDPQDEVPLPPTIHAVHHPTVDIQAGDPVYFAVRSFRLSKNEGEEVWDFGDGSATVTTNSNPAGVPGGSVHDPLGYAQTVHRFDQPGDHIVTVQRTNDHGHTATARLHVRVDPRQ
jgi:murein DD-endopeptidase MepM/ murein hydrolase activator NlpD